MEVGNEVVFVKVEVFYLWAKLVEYFADSATGGGNGRSTENQVAGVEAEINVFGDELPVGLACFKFPSAVFE